MISSDVDTDSNIRENDFITTTDDELYNDLMNAPAEFEDCLIPEKCENELAGIEHLSQCLNHRFNASPAVFMGTLNNALQEAFGSKEISDRRPFLIYVNNDKSIYTNLFCKQLLCLDKIIEYLMNNYILWAWDVTFESNARRLNSLCKAVFPLWKDEQNFNTNAINQYPLLIGICRNSNGEYLFNHLIESTTTRPTLGEFLTLLNDFKDKFYFNEQQLAKEEARKKLFKSLSHQHHSFGRSKHLNRKFVRSLSMLPHTHDSYTKPAHLSRLLSEAAEMGMSPDEANFQNFLSREEVAHIFEHSYMDSDDADDEEDLQTPTVENPSSKYH